MKALKITAVIFFLCSQAQAGVLWERTFGGKKDDVANAVSVLPDGNIILAGFTNSFGAGGWDVYLLKLSPDGEKIWEKAFGGEDWDQAEAVAVLPDGNIIVAGWTESFGAGKRDVYLLKLSPDGEKIWEKTFGGGYSDEANAVSVLPDGNIIVAGMTKSFGAGGQDVYVIAFEEKIYISRNNTPLYSITGEVLTKLPAGTVVKVITVKRNNYYVKVSENLRGWVKKENTSITKPDLLKPVIRILSKKIEEPYLYLKGIVYDDIRIKSVKFGGETLKRADFSAEKGNFGDVYPFEKKILLSPDMKFVLIAEDWSGKRTELPVNIKSPVVQYNPEYAVLKTKGTVNLREGPGENYKIVSKIAKGTQLTAIGYKGNWYLLDSGLWVHKRVVQEITFGVPPVSSTPVEIVKKRRIKIPKSVDVDVDIPEGAYKNKDAVGVIIGNRDYEESGVPPVDYAIHDAEIVKEYFVRTLGIPEGNIIFIKNAKLADFNRVFGTEKNYRGQLFNYIKEGKSDVYIYYVGHGAPDVNTKKAYFVPVDCHPDYVNLNGYPLDIFYSNLKKLPTKSITVILDACFTGESGSKEKPMLIAKASPIGISPISQDLSTEPQSNLTIITAGSKGEIASWLPEKGHSLFTYYFLKALKGEADLNKDKAITLSELKNYLNENVPYLARRLYNRDQHPAVIGNTGRVFVRLR